MIEKLHGSSHIPLARHAEDFLAMVCVGGILHGDKPEERSDRRKTRIPAAGTIVADRLEVVEKVADQFGIHVLDPEVRWRLAPLLGGEAQQQAKCVAVSGNRIR